MIGGMYLGDIVRRVILRMSQESDVFGPISSILLTPFILRYISLCLLFHSICFSGELRAILFPLPNEKSPVVAAISGSLRSKNLEIFRDK